MTGRPKIVVLGMMTVHPVGGVVWQALHYLPQHRRLVRPDPNPPPVARKGESRRPPETVDLLRSGRSAPEMGQDEVSHTGSV